MGKCFRHSIFYPSVPLIFFSSLGEPRKELGNPIHVMSRRQTGHKEFQFVWHLVKLVKLSTLKVFSDLQQAFDSWHCTCGILQLRRHQAVPTSLDWSNHLSICGRDNWRDRVIDAWGREGFSISPFASLLGVVLNLFHNLSNHPFKVVWT